MNRLIYLLLVFALACDDDETIPVNEEIRDVMEIATEDEWTITYFFGTDKEETNSFAGYIFTFESDNVLKASGDSNIYMGSWTITDSDPDDRAGDHDDIGFDLTFASPPDFEDLSDHWQVITISNVKIELKNVSGGNGGTDLLTFEKTQ
jgi:hypothetical protein